MISQLLYNLKNNSYNQHNTINKYKLGDVYSSYPLIHIMCSLLPHELFKDKHIKWFDPCVGNGNFIIYIIHKLNHSLESQFSSTYEAEKHILDNMIYSCEINPSYHKQLQNIMNTSEFPSRQNHIFINDFLSTSIHSNKEYHKPNFYDIIIGNPPFNSNGIKKVPTNNTSQSTSINNAKTIWPDFIFQSLRILKEGGYLCMIIPSIWLKPDIYGIHTYLFSPVFEITAIQSFSAAQTTSLFYGNAQTPTSIIVLRKKKESEYKHLSLSLYDPEFKSIPVFDFLTNSLVPFPYQTNDPIPTHSPSIVSIMINHTRNYNTLPVIKTSIPSNKKNKTEHLTSNKNSYSTYYTGIRSCIFNKSTHTCSSPSSPTSPTKIPTFKFETSVFPYPYQWKSKIIMAHKMYGIPFYDQSGLYGISYRDNYIILEDTLLKRWRDYTKNNSKKSNILFKQYMLCLLEYLSSSLCLFLFDTTRYRMRYLEKYAFHYIPDIMKFVYNNPSLYNPVFFKDDISICRLFELDESQITFITTNYPRYHYPNVFSPQ